MRERMRPARPYRQAATDWGHLPGTAHLPFPTRPFISYDTVTLGISVILGSAPMKSVYATLAAVGITFATFASVPAHATKIDLSTLTCKQFIDGSKDEIGTVLTWLDG
jgi:hypothetical protein